MKRRQLLQNIGLMMASGVFSPVLSNALILNNSKLPINFFDESATILLAEIGEIIIPNTNTPGSKTAKAHEFAFRIIENCYSKIEKNRFLTELNNFNEECKSKLGSYFINLNNGQKTEMIRDLISMKPKFFKEAKQLIVFGYFTSEVGATNALAYEPIPGKFVGCIPLKNNQKAWAI